MCIFLLILCVFVSLGIGLAEKNLARFKMRVIVWFYFLFLLPFFFMVCGYSFLLNFGGFEFRLRGFYFRVCAYVCSDLVICCHKVAVCFCAVYMCFFCFGIHLLFCILFSCVI